MPNAINLKLINNIPIGVKISGGILLVIGIFIFISLLINEKISTLESSFTQLTGLTENTTLVMDINRDVVELQRTALVYSQSGSNAIINKMNSTFEKITTNLNEVDKNNIDLESKKLIQSMQAVVSRYGENITALKDRYQYRKQLIDEQLPSLRAAGTEVIGSIVKRAESSNDFMAYRLAQNKMQTWLQANIDAQMFIKTRRYYLKQSVTEKLASIAQTGEQLKQRLSSITENEYQTFSSTLEQFGEIFEQAIQANRIYLSLVNVVMAGEALEFTSLSQQLRQRSLFVLEQITEESQFQVDESERIINTAISLALPFLIFIAYFYHITIGRSIKGVAESFTQLLAGKKDVVIPGLNRKDEIGRLAVAADAFKDMGESLQKAKVEAEELSSIKSKFLANMSHEIRTPMNGVLGMVTLLKSTKLSDEQMEMVNTISSSGDSLMTILNDILDLSKAESGKITLDNNSFSFMELINEISFMFTSIANEKGIQFKTILESAHYPKYIQADVTRLKQILYNLISNAIKFTDKGQVTFEIKSSQVSDANFKLSFIVSDTGVGIRKSAQKYLFDAFNQADTSITRRFGGSGLGLTISAKLARLFNSRIQLESTANKGSKFWFEIEVKESLAMEQADSSDTFIVTQEQDILVVEDNAVNIKIATLMLKKLGHHIEVAENGQIALDMVKRKPFDIILMDIQMPVMDGLQAARLIKKLKSRAHIPIIAMTANVMQEDREKCLEAGMEYFVPKPINLDLLKQTLVAATQIKASTH